MMTARTSRSVVLKKTSMCRAFPRVLSSTARASDVRDLPVNLGLARLDERRVDFGEGAAAEEAVRRREGRGVRARDDLVSRRVYKAGFLLRVLAPEGEDNARLFFVDLAYDGVCESLPAAILVRVRHPRAHREHGVQEQNALLCPGLKPAVVGNV